MAAMAATGHVRYDGFYKNSGKELFQHVFREVG